MKFLKIVDFNGQVHNIAVHYIFDIVSTETRDKENMTIISLKAEKENQPFIEYKIPELAGSVMSRLKSLEE